MYYMHREGKKYDDSLRAVLFSCLGTVFLERASTDEKQHYTRAETWLNRALEIQERQLKANPTDRTRLDLAITLCNLGELYRDRHEDYERAREFLTRALELKRKIYLHFPKIKLHLAKSCGMLAKTMYGMYEKSKDRAFLQSALDLGGETLGLLDWKSELEIQIYTSEFQRLMSKITYDYYGNNVKRAIHHQLAARDYNTGAMGVLEEVEDKSYSRYSRPRGAGFVHAALHCELADLCKRLSALYWEDNEYGRARFYSEYVDRKEATRERLRNSERVF
jgi:tetratricopeptide (TPR) repeat protein